ncbi:MAG: Gfo/Idh/MocA family protein [Fimbriimonas sp.]
MLKIGLVGCGFMGRMHANVYSALPNAELVGCVDLKPEVAEKFAAEFGCKVYGSLEEMAEVSGADVIDICLPTYLHSQHAIAAAKLGKHVFCEKPMALNLEDADAMIAACADANVQLMIGHCIRFWPEYAYLKRLVDSEHLGKLLSVNLLRFGAFPFWASDNWQSDEAKAGGGVMDMHIHDTDFAHYLLGDYDSIYSLGSVDDRGASHAFTTFKFGDVVLHAEGGWNLPATAPFKHAFRAIFERGAAMMDSGPLTIYEDGKEPVVPEFAKMEATGGGNISDLGGYFLEIQYFVNQILGGQPLEIVTPQSSRRSLETVLEEVRQIKVSAGK